MNNRVEIDPIVAEIINEMKQKHNIKTNKELVEKCIVFCSINNVIFNTKGVKTLNEVYFKLIDLQKSIENLPMNINQMLNSEI